MFARLNMPAIAQSLVRVPGHVESATFGAPLMSSTMRDFSTTWVAPGSHPGRTVLLRKQDEVLIHVRLSTTNIA
jgi:hypothetical protein